MALADEANKLGSIEALRDALRKSHAERLKLKLRNAELVEAVYGAAKEAALAVKPVKVKPPTKDTRKGKPEVALIHCTDWQLGKQIVERPQALGGIENVSPMLTATLAADHRVSDGHRGAQFLAALDRLLQEPEKLGRIPWAHLIVSS